MVANADERIEFGVATPGATDSAAAMQAVAAALQKMTDAFTGATPAAKAAGDALDGTKRKAKEADDALRGTAQNSRGLALTLNTLTRSISEISPELGGFTGAIGHSGRAISAMTSVLGGGAGLVAGGLIAAFGVFTAYLRDTKKEQEELAAATEKANKAFEEQQKILTNAATAKDPAFWAQLVANGGEGGPSIEDAGKNRREVLAKIKTLRDKMSVVGKASASDLPTFDDGSGSGSNAALVKFAQDRELNEMQMKVDALQKEFDSIGEYIGIRQKLSNKPKPTLGVASKTKTGDGTTAAGRAELAREMGVAGGLESQKDEIAQQLSMAREADATQKRMLTESIANEKMMKARALDDEFNAKNDAYRRDLEAREKFDNEHKLIDERAQKRVHEMKDIGQSAYTAIGSTGIQALNSLAKGQKVTAKEVLSSIGDIMVAEGTRYIFQGAASLNPIVAGIGAAEVAAGLAIGAATRGGGSSGGGGGGGAGGGVAAGGGQLVYNPDARGGYSPMSPTAPGLRPSSSGGNVTVLMNTTVAPNADDGVRVQRAVEEAKRMGRI